MVKKEPKEPEKDRLIVTKDEAKARLQKQIDEGEEIAELPVDNEAAVKQAKDKLESWYEFTKEVLVRVFSTNKMEQEIAWAVCSFGPDPLDNFRHQIDRYLHTLKSILKRVDLYDDMAPKEATQINVGYGSLNKKKVWVVHGRNKSLLDSMFSFLDAIGLEPIEWNEAIAMTRKPSPSVPEIVSTAFREAQATIVLLSGDDLAILRKKFIQEHDEDYEKELTPQARPNVLFEAGMAMAASQDRTVLVQVGKIRKFSDIEGLHITHLDNSPQKRQELITKLRSAECDIRDISADNRWMETGNFQDQLDSHEANINKPQSRPAISTLPEVKKKRLPLMQAESLLDRMKRERAVKDGTLADEFLDEYLNILDRAVSEWEGNDALIDLQKKGKLYPTMHFPPYSIDRLKWTINAVEKLVVIMESFG